MRRTECPGCGARLETRAHGDREIIPNHTSDGGPIERVRSPLCWLSCVELEEGRAIQAIIAEGGERLRLAAHP